MFSLYNEQKFFKAGNKRVTFNMDDVTCGLSICYDLRFPELFRAMALDGASVIFLPAQWPVVRGDVWRLLLQARAVENQFYMCGVNCVGEFKNDKFYGHSMLIAPNGAIITEGEETEAIIYSQIDTQLVDSSRSALSVLKDVRREFFKV